MSKDDNHLLEFLSQSRVRQAVEKVLQDHCDQSPGIAQLTAEVILEEIQYAVLELHRVDNAQNLPKASQVPEISERTR